MAKLAWPGTTFLAPVPPALVTCGTVEAPNVLTVAWTGILCSRPPRTYVSLKPERYSYGIINAQRAFVINLPTAALARAVDYCGVRSGRDEDKLKATGLTPIACPAVPPPMLEECPVSLACRVFDRIPLGSHDMFLADICAVYVDERLIDAKTGAVVLARMNLAAYAHGHYYALGEQLGAFGFSVRKKGGGTKRVSRR